MRPSRFERRIGYAILTVVASSLAASFGFGYVAVHDAFRTGVNPSVRSALEEGVAARRAHLVALRELTERTAESLAGDVELVSAVRAGDAAAAERVTRDVLGSHPAIARIAVYRGEDEQPFVEVAGATPRPSDEPMRPLERSRPLRGLDPAGGLEATVEVVLVEPERTFTGFQRAGETTDLLRRLEARREYVSNVYVGVYITFVLLISGAGLGLGLVLSRRVTRNLNALAEATAEVGRGDLGVSLPVRSDDEIGDLTRAFNRMVSDLRESRVRIEALQRIGAWQDFARRLAHEIKNPLTPIQLTAQELASSYRGEDPVFRRKLDDSRSIIEEEVATLRRLVSEFSNFARLPRVELASADLAEVAREFRRSLPALVEDTHGAGAAPEVVVRIDPGVIAVRLDAMMFRRALDNLARNALQAVRGRPGGGKVHIAVGREPGFAVLTVDDDGPGVPAADRERIFDPYFTTKSEGTGLGLPIVMKVVLEHGGSIALLDSPLGGACFRVRIPLSQEPP